MQLLFRHKGLTLSFLIFMFVFGWEYWIAGIFCWLHFVAFVMPASWRI